MGMAQTSSNSKIKSSTLIWVEKHPALLERSERLQEIGEDPQSDLQSMEAAKRTVLHEIERLGGVALRGGDGMPGDGGLSGERKNA